MGTTSKSKSKQRAANIFVPITQLERFVYTHLWLKCMASNGIFIFGVRCCIQFTQLTNTELVHIVHRGSASGTHKPSTFAPFHSFIFVVCFAVSYAGRVSPTHPHAHIKALEACAAIAHNWRSVRWMDQRLALAHCGHCVCFEIRHSARYEWQQHIAPPIS